MGTENKPKVFMIMPFVQEILDLYEELKKDFGADFEFTNAGDLDNQQNILHDIIEGIYQADVIIADLTGLNPNVFYELGVAHAMDKKVIILTQDINELPFDIKSYRAVQYSLIFNKIPALIDELRKLLSGAIDGSVKYGSPVSDYAPNFCVEGKKLENSVDVSRVLTTLEVTDLRENVGESEGERGFLDYIADITQNTYNVTNELTAMSEEMDKMSDAINDASDEIDRVKTQSGHADANFIRNVCRKLASPIDEYSGKLSIHTNKIGEYWALVENSYLDLLDNRYTRKKENIEGLKNSFDALNGLQSTMSVADDQVEDFVAILRDSLGMERRLNKAITTLITELEAYLTATDTISSSIDRIVSKGKIVIDNI